MQFFFNIQVIWTWASAFFGWGLSCTSPPEMATCKTKRRLFFTKSARKRPPGPPLANRAWAKTGIWLKRAWAGNADALNLKKCKNTIRIYLFWAPIKWPADERLKKNEKLKKNDTSG